MNTGSTKTQVFTWTSQASHVKRRTSNSASLLPGAFGLATKPRWNGWNGWNGSSRKTKVTNSFQILIQIKKIKNIISWLTSIYWNLHSLKCNAATHSFLHQIVTKFDELFWRQISAGQLHCKDCGGFFAGQRGLQDHQRQKHNKAVWPQHPSMDWKLKNSSIW